MAFNWPTFRTRALTAIVFVAVMLTGLLWNQWSFLVLFSIIHFGCWWEYFRLLEKIHRVTYDIYVKMGWMLLGYGLMIWFCGNMYRIASYGVRQNVFLPVSIAGFILLIVGIFMSSKIKLKSFGAAALGILYISLSWGLLLYLFSSTINLAVPFYNFSLTGPIIPIIIIASIWINDTMAYIVGSFIGRRPLSSISPKKTWEGTIGGIILAVGIVGWLLPLLFLPKELNTDLKGTTMLFAPVALIAAVMGTLGDLLESKLKRMAGVKDSGSIMPGHGGFLDRFDSLLVAIPFVWLFLYFLFFKS
ncbi:MAG: phosphatidate cytidylyltransferase [Sphingobacteriales bacterium]|jgi:phosphatidate cytidylyltransferase|nr:phosphatidate cytidylyltransferase [Sphingobacteriales bacterium]OJW03048.1 MAG: phosphatidate cytidylyltransferase [Sphingobacteriales bacterium 44-61]